MYHIRSTDGRESEKQVSGLGFVLTHIFRNIRIGMLF